MPFFLALSFEGGFFKSCFRVISWGSGANRLACGSLRLKTAQNKDQKGSERLILRLKIRLILYSRSWPSVLRLRAGVVALALLVAGALLQACKMKPCDFVVSNCRFKIWNDYGQNKKFPPAFLRNQRFRGLKTLCVLEVLKRLKGLS